MKLDAVFKVVWSMQKQAHLLHTISTHCSMLKKIKISGKVKNAFKKARNNSFIFHRKPLRTIAKIELDQRDIIKLSFNFKKMLNYIW